MIVCRYVGSYACRISIFIILSACVVQNHDPAAGTCGTSRFKAAKESSKTMKNLDETGIVISGCRHVIARRAVNMFRGEL